MEPVVGSTLDAHGMLAVALEQARIGFAEGGVPVGGAIFHVNGTLLGAGHNRLVQEGNGSLHGETDAFRAAGRRPTWHDTILVTTLAPCWYCSGLIYQFRFRQVIVGDSVNAQGGMHWLKEQGIDIVDLHSQECIDLIAKFQGCGRISGKSALARRELEPLKEKMRATWMAGDFGKIAEYSAAEGELFVDSLGIQPAMQVLDVACGTGNLAIPAASKGARVTGVDIASNLLMQARQRAAAEGLQITFEEGDAEQLPFPDANFDVVMTMFGAMFAPDPDRVAAELARVCRHGGKIAMANWTPDGFTGKMFRLTSRYLPPPVELPAPTLWGDEAVASLRLKSNGVKIESMQRRILPFDYPFPPREVVQFFRDYFGPTKVAFSRMDEARQAEYRDDLEKLWSKHNQAHSGKTLIQNEYLEVIGTRL